MMRSRSLGLSPVASIAAITPIAWLAAVVGILASITRAPAGSVSVSRRSVKVPPTSIPAILRVFVIAVSWRSYGQVGFADGLVRFECLDRTLVAHGALLDD